MSPCPPRTQISPCRRDQLQTSSSEGLRTFPASLEPCLPVLGRSAGPGSHWDLSPGSPCRKRSLLRFRRTGLASAVASTDTGWSAFTLPVPTPRTGAALIPGLCLKRTLGECLPESHLASLRKLKSKEVLLSLSGTLTAGETSRVLLARQLWEQCAWGARLAG